MKGAKQRFHHLRHNTRVQSVAFIALFAVIGVLALLLTQAAGSTASLEPELSSTKTGVTTPTSASASNNSYVKFGSGSGGGGGGYTTLTTKPGGWAWQWQLDTPVVETALDGTSNPNKMIDIDWENANTALITRLKAKGLYVVCYVESGDWNVVRGDKNDYPSSILGNGIGGFPDEKYIKVYMLDSPAGPAPHNLTLRGIMQARLQSAKDKGCQGIEPDLDDLHTYTASELGFSISQAQMVAYNKVIIDMGHALGMSVGLKNGADDGSPGSFTKAMLNAGADWVINEECNQYDECDGYQQFIAAGKPVFQVEYLDNQGVSYTGTGGSCAKDNTAGYDGIVKDSSETLKASPRIPCRTGN